MLRDAPMKAALWGMPIFIMKPVNMFSHINVQSLFANPFRAFCLSMQQLRYFSQPTPFPKVVSGCSVFSRFLAHFLPIPLSSPPLPSHQLSRPVSSPT